MKKFLVTLEAIGITLWYSIVCIVLGVIMLPLTVTRWVLYICGWARKKKISLAKRLDDINFNWLRITSRYTGLDWIYEKTVGISFSEMVFSQKDNALEVMKY